LNGAIFREKLVHIESELEKVKAEEKFKVFNLLARNWIDEIKKEKDDFY